MGFLKDIKGNKETSEWNKIKGNKHLKDIFVIKTRPINNRKI